MIQDLQDVCYGFVGSASVDLVFGVDVGVLLHVFRDLVESECVPGAYGDGVGVCLVNDEDCLYAVGV